MRGLERQEGRRGGEWSERVRVRGGVAERKGDKGGGRKRSASTLLFLFLLSWITCFLLYRHVALPPPSPLPQATPLYTTSHHATSHQTSPYYASSHHTNSHHKLHHHTSRRTISHHNPPQYTTSHHTTFNHTTPHYKSSHHITLNYSTSLNATLATSHDTSHHTSRISQHTTSTNAASYHTISHTNPHYTSHHTTPHTTTPHTTTPHHNSHTSTHFTAHLTTTKVNVTAPTTTHSDVCEGEFQRGSDDPRLIVIWTPFWHQWGAWRGIVSGRGNFKDQGCPVWSCVYKWGPSVSGADAASADAVLFFSLDLLLRPLPPRTQRQHWIWLELEAPPISRVGAEAWAATGIEFNLTMSYHRRNHIPVVNGFLVPHTTRPSCPVMPTLTLNTSTHTHDHYTRLLIHYDEMLRGSAGRQRDKWLREERAKRHPLSKPLYTHTLPRDAWVWARNETLGRRRSESETGNETLSKRRNETETRKETLGGRWNRTETGNDTVGEKWTEIHTGKETIGGRRSETETGNKTFIDKWNESETDVQLKYGVWTTIRDKTNNRTGNERKNETWRGIKKHSWNKTENQELDITEHQTQAKTVNQTWGKTENQMWKMKENQTRIKTQNQTWGKTENQSGDDTDNEVWKGKWDGTFMGLTQEEIQLAIRPKMAAWMASNCPTESRREELVSRLSQFLPITTVGRCGVEKCGRNHMDIHCYTWLASSHLFYLALENALCEDYVTEKLWRALEFGMVPVVYGDGDYSEILPQGSYINAEDFTSAASLAAHLLHLANHPAHYARYLLWRRLWRVVWPAPWCELCAALYHPAPPRPVTAENWWTDTARCRPPPAW